MINLFYVFGWNWFDMWHTFEFHIILEYYKEILNFGHDNLSNHINLPKNIKISQNSDNFETQFSLKIHLGKTVIIYILLKILIK